MPQEIATRIEIDASARRVWSVLTDFAAYPLWNSFLPKVRGVPEVGERIRFWFELPRGFRAPACATILKAEVERELRWAGRLPGLLRAEHYFVIDGISESKVVFLHGEIFSGLLVPILWPILRGDSRRVYEEMNVALKQRVEQGAAVAAP